MTIQGCKIDDCDKGGRLKRGMCAMHYQRFMKYGDPHAGIAKYDTWQEALDNRVRTEGDCLIWTGSVNQWGYGRTKTQNGGLRVVHHLAWERANGPIPDGMELDHVCFNRACINTDHLRPATKSENARHRQGAQPNSKSGVRNVHATPSGRWRVRLKVEGKHLLFGSYDTIEEAEQVAIRARREVFNRP